MHFNAPTELVSSNRFRPISVCRFRGRERLSYPLMWNRGANHYLLSEAHTGCPQALKISIHIIPSEIKECPSDYHRRLVIRCTKRLIERLLRLNDYWQLGAS